MNRQLTWPQHDRMIQEKELMHDEYLLLDYKHRLNPKRTNATNKFLRTFTYMCSNGHTLKAEDTIQTPRRYSNVNMCWCHEEHPLRRERRRNNLTTYDVADALGLNHVTIAGWENSINTVPIKRALQLYELYECDEQTIKEIEPYVTKKWNSKYDPPTLGKVYGELTVIEDYRIEDKNTLDSIQTSCSCGRIKDVKISYLIRGQARSCGHRTEEFKHMLRKNQIRKPSIYIPLIGLKNYFNDQYTLNHFSDDNRSNQDTRLYTYDLECKCGRIYKFENVMITPREYCKTRKCICEYANALINERKRNKLSKENVTKKLGISKKHLEIWENLAYDIHVNDLSQLYDLYQTPNVTRRYIREYKESIGSEILSN